MQKAAGVKKHSLSEHAHRAKKCRDATTSLKAQPVCRVFNGFRGCREGGGGLLTPNREGRQVGRSAARLPGEGGGGGMTPWCVVLVCSWRRLLADRHSLPFPWTLSLHKRWCPSASHHPLTFLFLLALTFPLYFPFPFLGLSLRRPWCPSASHHSFPFHSLGRLCQRSPQTCPVSLLRVEST